MPSSGALGDVVFIILMENLGLTNRLVNMLSKIGVET